MLDDFFAALVFEIHVNVGRLPAGLGYEPFEHHRDCVRPHFGNAQHIANDRIRGRPAPLAQDTLWSGEGDNVIDGQEVGRETELVDQG